MIKIAFSGIGGVGGYYGGMLAAFYQQSQNVGIYFISRGKNLDTIQKKGILIRTADTSTQAMPRLVTENPEEIGTVDYLFCTTKSYDLDENIVRLSPLIGEHTIIIPLLNGADITDRVRRLLPHNQVWYGCVYIGARLSEPGLVTKFTQLERLWFGNPDTDSEKQRQLLKLLVDAGINAENPADILFRIWKKFLLISVGATLTSYYNQSVGEIIEHHREDYFRLSKELENIARAKGITLPEDITSQLFEDQKGMPYDSTTSMHTDFKNGKQTELETLTGFVVRTGEEYGIPTPTYKMMYEALKQRP